jgi:putative pyruvate formate lyase activating enzyme
MPLRPVLARAGLHSWEEPPLSGTRGAGTVFFSGCVLRCVYCQNDKISRENFGRAVTVPRLRDIFQELIAQGAHNIDLVNPTHFAPAIAEALHEPLSVPVIWNSGGYERVSALRTLAGKIQIYLPDFKYPDAEAAEKYSGARDYPAVAAGAIREMAEQTGGYEYGENGLLRRGVLIRHLLLPGRVSQAKQVMDWIAGTFPPKTVLFSLMSQYTPTAGAGKFPELNRRLRPSEIRAAAEYMSALGLEGFTQDLAAAEESYVPPFDGTGI